MAFLSAGGSDINSRRTLQLLKRLKPVGDKVLQDSGMPVVSQCTLKKELSLNNEI